MNYMTVAEVAGDLRVDESTVRRLIRAGQLPATRVGRQYRIAPADLAEYKKRSEVPTPKKNNSGLALAH